MWAKVLIFHGANPIFDVGSLSYYDLPFEETVRRHGTKPNRFSFGEEDMRRWWREKDYIGLISEEIITAEVSLSEAVNRIYHAVTGSI